MALTRFGSGAGTGTPVDLADHINDPVDAHDASAISVAPSGDLTSTDVQAALVELQGDIDAEEAALAAHLADTTDAHDASAISVDSTTLVGVATDVQGALEELDNGIADHLADTTAAHAASAVSFSAAAGIAATDVQAALEEIGNTIGSTSSMGFRNRIINGDMRIDQRNAGASISATSSGVFPVDRFYAYEDTDGTATVQQLTTGTPPAGFTHYLRFTVTSADASLSAAQFAIIQHRIEGSNISDLDFGLSTAKTVTLSFWVRSSLTGTFGGAIKNAGSDRSYPFTYSISAANTWETKTVTIAGDTTGTWLTTTGIGITVSFGLGVGSTNSGTANTWAAANYYTATGATSVIGTNGATFDLTGVQLEAGTTATSFERESYSAQLAKCQRYYSKSFPIGTAPVQNSGTGAGAVLAMQTTGASTTNYIDIRFPVRMRAAPTVVTYNPNAANAQVRNSTAGSDCSALAGYTGNDVNTIYSFTTAGGSAAGAANILHWAANAEI